MLSWLLFNKNKNSGLLPFSTRGLLRAKALPWKWFIEFASDVNRWNHDWRHISWCCTSKQTLLSLDFRHCRLSFWEAVKMAQWPSWRRLHACQWLILEMVDKTGQSFPENQSIYETRLHKFKLQEDKNKYICQRNSILSPNRCWHECCYIWV